MRRYRLPCACTVGYLSIITAATLYESTQDTGDPNVLALIIVLLAIALAGCVTAWSWWRTDRRENRRA